MKKFEVTLVTTSLRAATVTLVEAARLHHSEHAVSFTNGDGQNVAVFPLGQVQSVKEVVEQDDVDPHAPKKASELPKLSRKHPVYAYGKGDLAEALRRVRDSWARGEPATSYLNDILRDLIKGK